MIDLDDVLAHAHDNCAVCEGTGVVRCWSPGGPCPEGQTVCESCGPCQQSDVPTLVAALREARAGWAADYAVQDDRIGELQAERDDWRRRYEALRDGVTGLTEDEWGSRADETERCPLCRRKWSKHTDYDGRCYDGASTLAGYIRDLRAVVARVEES